MSFDLSHFLTDLDTFVQFKTCVTQNPGEFAQARAWIRSYFVPGTVEFTEVVFEESTNLLLRPRGSSRPKLLGDGHIEVVPAENELFALRRENGYLYGRGVADMKSQCLMMMSALRDAIAAGKHHDFWILFSEDEEIGSPNGARRMVGWLAERDWLPDVVFVPDGGPDFAYVEKEKGMLPFTLRVKGRSAHGSRPFLGENAIEKMMALYAELQLACPNPRREAEWIPSLSITRIKAGEAQNKIPDVCTAGFDMRFTELQERDELLGTLRSIAGRYGAELRFQEIGTATYFPRERPLAQAYIELLRQVSGKEPAIMHTNGASNARFYVGRKPDVQVLMSGPGVVGLHADSECLVADSLPAYYRLVRETMKLAASHHR